MDKKLDVTFEWQQSVGNLLPTEINRILNKAAEELSQAAGKTIDDATYEFNGKTHNVPIKSVSSR